jgi:hypothetical protein
MFFELTVQVRGTSLVLFHDLIQQSSLYTLHVTATANVLIQHESLAENLWNFQNA